MEHTIRELWLLRVGIFFSGVEILWQYSKKKKIAITPSISFHHDTVERKQSGPLQYRWQRLGTYIPSYVYRSSLGVIHYPTCWRDQNRTVLTSSDPKLFLSRLKNEAQQGDVRGSQSIKRKVTLQSIIGHFQPQLSSLHVAFHHPLI